MASNKAVCTEQHTLLAVKEMKLTTKYIFLQKISQKINKQHASM